MGAQGPRGISPGNLSPVPTLRLDFTRRTQPKKAAPPWLAALNLAAPLFLAIVDLDLFRRHALNLGTIPEGKGQLHLVQMPGPNKTQGPINRLEIKGLGRIPGPSVGSLKVEPARDLSQQRFHVCPKTHRFQRSCLLAPPCKETALASPSIADANPDFPQKPRKNPVFRQTTLAECVIFTPFA